MAVAILGLSASQEEAPWDDVTWQKWGLPWSEHWAECDRLFEMHELPLLIEFPDTRPPDYFEKLTSVWVPLYMQEKYTGIPCLQYPFKEVAKTTGAYWNSSIGYMLALAIHEKHRKIGVWGVDMKADEEYFYQRPNCEYLIGLARGLGIEVIIPESSPVCKLHGTGINFGKHPVVYKDRYGKR